MTTCSFRQLVKGLCALAMLGSIGYADNMALAQSEAAPPPANAPASSPANTIDVPLSGPAFTIANEAYDAFNRRDYETAIVKVREAIRQRPDVARLKILLLDALEASGQTGKAAKEAKTFADENASSSEISGQVNILNGRLAQKAAEQVYRSFERNDYKAAVQYAQEAVRLKPDENAFRHLLTLAQLREREFSAAEQSASETLNADAEDPVAMMFRSTARLKKGEVQQGLEDAEDALKQGWVSEEDMNNMRLIASDYMIAAGEYDKAQDVLSRFTGDAALKKQRQEKIMQARRFGVKAPDRQAVEAIMVPQLDCRVTPYGRTCSLIPGTPPADAGYPLAVEAQDAFKAHNYSLARAKIKQAIQLSPNNNAYREVQNNIERQIKADRKPKAQPSNKPAPQAAPDPAYEKVRQIGQMVDQGQTREARQSYDDALARGRLKSVSSLDLAYLATRVGDSATAYTQFNRARDEGRLNGSQLVDAAYAARRVYDNDLAIELLKTAIDEIGDQLSPQELFNLKREVATLSRTWGAYLSINHGSVTPLPGRTTSSSTTQFGSEIYWRPPGIGYRDGAIFELFARDFTTLHDDNDGPTGWSTSQTSIGVRWKPFKKYNLVLEAARLFRLGDNSRNDTMLRVAFSEGQGGDLRLDVPSWWMWQGYGELGRYIEGKQTFSTLDFRAGRSFRLDSISDRLVVTPYLSINSNFDSLLEEKWAVGAGPGLNLRWWFREDKYTAPMSYVDVNVQYRFRLGGDDRAKGFFAGVNIAF